MNVSSRLVMGEGERPTVHRRNGFELACKRLSFGLEVPISSSVHEDEDP